MSEQVVNDAVLAAAVHNSLERDSRAINWFGVCRNEVKNVRVSTRPMSASRVCGWFPSPENLNRVVASGNILFNDFVGYFCHVNRAGPYVKASGNKNPVQYWTFIYFQMPKLRKKRLIQREKAWIRDYNT